VVTKTRGKPSHMEQAGVDPQRVSFVQERAAAAEVWLAQFWEGIVRAPFDPHGDVTLPDERVVDVKRIEPGSRFVNGGTHPMRAEWAIVVVDGRDGFSIAGAVHRSEWRWEAPIKGGFTCWTVRTDELHPVVEPPEPFPWEVD